MGCICKLIIDGEEQTFEYDSVCSECGKLLLERIEVSTIEDNNIDKHICEYCSRYVDMY